MASQSEEEKEHLELQLDLGLPGNSSGLSGLSSKFFLDKQLCSHVVS